MGRTGKVEEDGSPTGILASDPTLDIDLQLMLVLLDQQAQAWRQELEQMQRSPGAPADVVSAYTWMLERWQQELNTVYDFERISHSPAYKRTVLKKMKEFKEWVEDEIARTYDLPYKDNPFFQTRGAFARTLFAILEEFI